VGFARQTPMLAGRVGPRGPYGWIGDGRTLEQRILHGFSLHRWRGRALDGWMDFELATPRARAIAQFLREGLVPPPVEDRALTASEKRGQELFESDETRCSSCHFPATGYSDRGRVTLARWPIRAGHANEGRPFKTPSLLFVGGTAPYYHDGSASTLLEVLEGDHDRMGNTDQLSAGDRVDLAAYLATIGSVPSEWLERTPAPPSVASADADLAPVDLECAPPAPAEDTSSLATDPPAEEQSASPTSVEWKDAEDLALLRMPKPCTAQRLREWLRLECVIATPHEFTMPRKVALVAGSRDGVEFGGTWNSVNAVFPLRRGDRRVFVIDDHVASWRGFHQTETELVVSEAWLDGAAAPVVTVTERAR
jgi:mono/diheme cytochrome c family protein